MHLWVVPDDDEVAENAKQTISKIIEENRVVAEQAIHVYEDYMWILNEQEVVDEFLKQEPFDRKKFQAQVDKYQATIEEIREKMPFELRLNMFLVECKDINDALCKRLDDLMLAVLDKATEFVFTKLALEISNEVKAIKEELAPRASESEVLVNLEKRLAKLKEVDHKRIKDDYNDMIEWYLLLQKNPRQKLNDNENIRPIINAFMAVNDIVNIIENSDQRLAADKGELSSRVLNQQQEYLDKMQELKQRVNLLAQGGEVSIPKEDVKKQAEVNDIIA